MLDVGYLRACLDVSDYVLVTRMSCAKTAEPIEMPLGMLTLVGPIGTVYYDATWRIQLNNGQQLRGFAPCFSCLSSVSPPTIAPSSFIDPSAVISFTVALLLFSPLGLHAERAICSANVFFFLVVQLFIP